MNKLRCALLGSTGMIGQRFISLLSDHPFFETSNLLSKRRREGSRFHDSVEWTLDREPPQEISQLEFHKPSLEILESNNIDLVFSSLPGSIEKDIEAEFAKGGYPVISNSAVHRYDKDVPILIPEVNGDHLPIIEMQESSPDGFLITNPNCSTTGISMVLAPLMKFNLDRIHATTYQAISGAGLPGIPSYSMADNIIPHIPGEEEKIIKETSKILGYPTEDGLVEKKLEIIPTCARVPVSDGHLISLDLRFSEPVSVEDIRDAFNSFRSIDELPSSPSQPIIVRDEEDRPQPRRDRYAGSPIGGMAVTVGRIRKRLDEISFLLLVNNTIRGGAGNAVLSAELALKRGYLRGD